MLTPEQIKAARERLGITPMAPTSAQTPTAAPKTDIVSDLISAWKTPQSKTKSAEARSAERFQPTFPSESDDSALEGAVKTVGNIPSSAFNMAKNIAKGLNPITTLKNIAKIPEEVTGLAKETGGFKQALEAAAKELIPTTYHALVPTFVQNLLAGDTEEAERTIENDPVGQILPIITLANAAAKKMGYGEQFDKAISTTAKPVTVPVKFVAKQAGKVVSQVLGTGTGAGASSIREAFDAAKSNKPEVFREAMRGTMDPEKVVQSAQEVVQKIADQRRSTYVSDLEKISKDKSTLDITPVLSEVKKQLKNFGVKVDDSGDLDFSRSSIANNKSARADVQGVYDTVKNWGSQAGDRTPVGLDTLKKQLGDFYTDSGSARAFVQAIKSKVSDSLKTQVEGYEGMTSKYQAASDLLDDIKSATGAGSKQKVDTVFTKLTTAMKADKEFRLQVLKEMEAFDPQLMDKIAGINLQPFIPRGLVGRGADIGSAFAILTGNFNPAFIPMLLGTSPRIVGEFLNAAGYAANKVSKITNAVETLSKTFANLSPVGSVQENIDQVLPEEESPLEELPSDDATALGPFSQKQFLDLVDIATIFMPGGVIAKQGIKVAPNAIKSLAQMHPDDLRILTKASESIKAGAKLPEVVWNRFREILGHYGLQSPSNQKKAADQVLLMQESAQAKKLHSEIEKQLKVRFIQNPKSGRFQGSRTFEQVKESIPFKPSTDILKQFKKK